MSRTLDRPATTYAPPVAATAAPVHGGAATAAPTAADEARASARAGRRWAAAIVTVLGATMAVNFWMLQVAARDGGVNAEPDYYRKAIDWDAAQARAAASAALGWSAAVTPVARQGRAVAFRIALAGRDGVAIAGARVTVRARWNGDATNAVQGVAVAAGDGYALTLPLAQGGLHELRVEAVRGGDAFETTVKLDVPAR